jgi:hypothetical protein
LDGVVTGKLIKGSEHFLIDCWCNAACLAFIHIEDTLLNTASSVARGIAVAVVHSILQDAGIPAVDEICVISVTGSIAIREDEWLRGVQSLRPEVIEISRTPVNLHKNTWDGNRKFGITAGTGIGTRR